MDPVQMGRFLARLRREAGLTQEALGQTLGVTNKTVSRWENGNYLPDLEMLQLLGARFGVSVDELICGGRIPVQRTQGAPERTMTDRAVSGQADPMQMKSEQAAPEQTAPTQMKPERATPEHIVLAQMKPEQAAPEQAAPAQMKAEQNAPEQTAPAQMKAKQNAPEQTIPKQTASARIKSEQEQPSPEQAGSAEAAAGRFALAERIAYWKRKWLREHLPSLILCYALLCMLLPVAASALELAGNVPFLAGGWGLLTLVFYIAARNRMMIYVESRAFLP